MSLLSTAWAFGTKPKSDGPIETSSSAWVSRGPGNMQCSVDEGKSGSSDAGALELAHAKITVFETRKTSDGKMHIQLCDTPSGDLYNYRIRQSDFAKAMGLGFRESHDLK